jgi:hypothetical protein
MRAGLFDNALEAASRLPETAEVTVLTAATYAACMSLALLGRNDEATRRIEAHDQLVQLSGYAWLQQLWALERSDALLLMGRPVEAIRSAWRGTTNDMSSPLEKGVTGAFARWTHCFSQAPDLPFDHAANTVMKIDKAALDALDAFEVAGGISGREGSDLGMLSPNAVALSERLRYLGVSSVRQHFKSREQTV